MDVTSSPNLLASDIHTIQFNYDGAKRHNLSVLGDLEQSKYLADSARISAHSSSLQGALVKDKLSFYLDKYSN